MRKKKERERNKVAWILLSKMRFLGVEEKGHYLLSFGDKIKVSEGLREL